MQHLAYCWRSLKRERKSTNVKRLHFIRFSLYIAEIEHQQNMSPLVWALSVRKNYSESVPNNTEEKVFAESCPTTMQRLTQSGNGAEPSDSCNYRNGSIFGHVFARSEAKCIWKLGYFLRNGQTHVSQLDCCRIVVLELNHYLCRMVMQCCCKACGFCEETCRFCNAIRSDTALNHAKTSRFALGIEGQLPTNTNVA